MTTHHSRLVGEPLCFRGWRALLAWCAEDSEKRLRQVNLGEQLRVQLERRRQRPREVVHEVERLRHRGLRPEPCDDGAVMSRGRPIAVRVGHLAMLLLGEFERVGEVSPRRSFR